MFKKLRYEFTQLLHIRVRFLHASSVLSCRTSLLIFPSIIPSNYWSVNPSHPTIIPSIALHPINSSTMANAEVITIIQPLYYKLEELLDLNPILGKLFSKDLFKHCHMQRFRYFKDFRMEQNREFLSYLLTQPVQQLKTFCHVLQRDVGNASHQELAEEILDAIPPDHMEIISGVKDNTPVCQEIIMPTCQSMDR